MENLEKENFNKLEDVLGEMESIKKLIGLMLSEILEFRANALTHAELAEKYTMAQTLSHSAFTLLCGYVTELKSFIENQSKK